MTGREQDEDQLTAYGLDQDREGTSTATYGEDESSSDLNPDDYGPESTGGADINPDTGAEPGAIDNSPRTP